MGLSSTLTMSSVFEGMCLKTSAFSLLSMCGPSMSWSFLIWSSLAMSANSSRNPSRLLQRRKKHKYGVSAGVLSGSAIQPHKLWPHMGILTWISLGSGSSASGRAPPGCSEEECQLAAACVAAGSCLTLGRTNNRPGERWRKQNVIFWALNLIIVKTQQYTVVSIFTCNTAVMQVYVQKLIFENHYIWNTG